MKNITILGIGFLSAIFGILVILSIFAENKPYNEDATKKIEINTPVGYYSFPVDSMVSIDKLNCPEIGDYYMIYIDSSFGRKAIEITDLTIQGDTYTAEELKESFIMTYKEFL